MTILKDLCVYLLLYQSLHDLTNKRANLPAMKTGSIAEVLLEKGKYRRKAHIGQVDVLVGYTWIWWPFQKGSVLDCLRLTVILLL